MPYFGEYILKLSVSFSIVCLFYQLVLKRLTFYNWNRFYLLGYTFLCFFIPLIDISGVAQSSNMTVYKTIELIPSIMPVSAISSYVVADVNGTARPATDLLFVLFLTGVMIMVIRFAIQLLSLRRLIRKAALISDEKVKLYQVNSRIIPFAFGRSVFINRYLHETKDIEEIIRHEFVHIRQKHSIDIIWAELLCVFNWYNPFVWWLRNSIKQNLEYLADDKVLQDGIDKKQYQYLLLKVLGDHRFAIVSPFNFSSLKKRIAMMNKMKSTGIHLLKFLFIVPLMAVMIMAFRKDYSALANKAILSVSGITFDGFSKLPIAGVTVRDSITGLQTISDNRGFYTLNVPIEVNMPRLICIRYLKNGYSRELSLNSTANSDNISHHLVVLAGMVTEKDKSKGVRPSIHSIIVKNELITYSYVQKKLQEQIIQNDKEKEIENSIRPIRVIDGIPHAFTESGVAWFSKEEVAVSPECKAWFDGKIMSIEEVNNTVSRFELNSVGAMPKAQAKKILGVDCNVLMLAKDSSIPRDL